MHPTLFRIPFLPEWLADVKSYGIMMMIAFLTGIWLSCRRAVRSRGNPDVVINMGFIALIFGVLGARIMYVWHYWDTRFANMPHPWLEVVNIRAGGLEFLGGPILVIPALMIYLRFVAKVSMRWYLDMTIPALAWGEGVTRIGCFLNGCCWGAVCASGGDPSHAALPWAVRFPYGSPAMVQQFRFGQLTLPKELIVQTESGESFPLPREFLDEYLKDGGATWTELQDEEKAARKRLDDARTASAEAATLKRLSKEAEDAAKRVAEFGATPIGTVQRQCRIYDVTGEELAELASHYKSRFVHPAQLYSFVNAMLLCWLLSVGYYYRRRHGVVITWFFVLYPVSRFLLELIRQDNPLDFGGLTISQMLGLALSVVGVAMLVFLYRFCPEASPRAAPYTPPDDEEPTARPVARKRG